MFSRENRRPKGAEFKIYLSFEDCRGFRCGSLFGAVVVSTGCRWSGNSCYFANVSKNGQNPLLSSAYLLCSRCVVLEYALISRFKGVFRGFYGVCVGLYWPGALRGLWGFCVREWLGGFMACGDFLQNLSFCPSVFLSCPAFVLLSRFASALGLWCCLCCGCRLSFPFGLYAKRRGAPCWCVLSCPVVVCRVRCP